MYQFMHDNSNADKTNKGAQIVFFLRLAMVVWNLNVFFFTKTQTNFIWFVISDSTWKSTDMKIIYI